MRAVDPTLLVSLNTILRQQSNPTRQTVATINQILNYVATNPEATIMYTPSDMILKAHTDVSYLSEPGAKSRFGGHFYMGKRPARSITTNGPVLNTASILRNIVSSAAEAEYGGMFMNARAALPLQQALIEMGYKQPTTPMQSDNDTTTGIANEIMKQKHSKKIDMRFHRIQDCVCQKQFVIYWEPGIDNLADCFSKHHLHIIKM